MCVFWQQQSRYGSEGSPSRNGSFVIPEQGGDRRLLGWYPGTQVALIASVFVAEQPVNRIVNGQNWV